MLNRVVRWTSGGLEYEADPSQAEKSIRDTELQGANAVTTPGVKPLPHQLEQEQPLSMADFARFREKGARANHLQCGEGWWFQRSIVLFWVISGISLFMCVVRCIKSFVDVVPTCFCLSTICFRLATLNERSIAHRSPCVTSSVSA